MNTSAPHRRNRASLAAAVVAFVTSVLVAGVAWGPSLFGTAAGSEAVAADATTSVFPGEVDFCYAQMMIPHHEQAIEMSAMLLAKPGVSERSRAFAEFVSADQGREVTATTAWIESWRTEYTENPPTTVVAAPLGSVHHGSAAPPETQRTDPDLDVDRLVDCGDAADPARFATMAGMLSTDQLELLRAAPAHEAEILYLRLMIPHHDGALAMSRDVVLGGVNYFTVQMARHILNEQQREIVAMTAMIEEIS